MIIGIPKEIKQHEYRVGLTPNNVKELVSNGHTVIVEHNAGLGIGFTDADYQAAGATVLETAEAIFEKAELIVKVKEPQLNECALLRSDQTLFTYLHLSPDPAQTAALIKSGCIAIAYETVTDNGGRLPLLSPMSEVAGRLSVQAGAKCLEKPQGGRGILLGGVPGVNPGRVLVIGGGVVGTSALKIAIGYGAHVTVVDRCIHRLRELDMCFGPRLHTLYATKTNIAEEVAKSDLVIGAVLVAGRAAPKLVTRDNLKTMRPGSVIVDVSVDQGGCFETTKPTTHQDPTFVVNDVVHYCVANMPGAVPHTATIALNNATLPFVLDLANKGVEEALVEDPHLRNGLNIYKGAVTHQAVAEDLNYTYTSPDEALQVH